MKKFYLAISIVLTINFTAWACHTPTQSAKLNKKYPDWDFVAMMHKAHNQPYKGYKYNGQQSCVNGKADIFECQNVDLLGHLDLSQIGGGQGSDSWGWKHEVSGRYFALVGRSNGTSFVEITDPSNPVYLGNLPTSGGIATAWRDVKTYQDYAFIVADDQPHGMQVFNLTKLLSVENAPVEFASDTVYRGSSLRNAHNIFINEETGIAYVLGSNTCNGGLHMVNVQNPINPRQVGCYAEDGYTHDTQCLIYQGPDTDHRGKEICFSSNEDSITVVDVTDKSNPIMISKTGYDGQQYTHQGWLTADQRYFLIDDELDELERGQGTPDFTRTYVMDMIDLDVPVITGFHNAEGASIDHNQYIVDGHTYQANYTRGLRILKIGDLSQAELDEVAFFDTFPDTDESSNFGGAWNVYPFFDNGMVMISDVNRGVFIVKPKFQQETEIKAHHAGLWFNPEQDGHGLNVIVLDNKRMIIYWYVYDNDGNPLWLLGSGDIDGGTATLSVTQSTGGLFPPNFNAADIVNSSWGTFTVDVLDCSNLTFKWNPQDETKFAAGNMPMTRLAINAGLSCED